MSDKELLIKELIVKDFNEILVNEFCTDWKEKRLYIELLVRATHFDYLLNYIQEKEKEIERLNNKAEDLMTLYTTEREVKEDYKSIIKEVREKIRYWQQDYMETYISTDELDDILEILDKGE